MQDWLLIPKPIAQHDGRIVHARHRSSLNGRVSRRDERILSERPDLTAILDVTDPEPSPAGHAFYTLQNCILTPHIAGSIGNEVWRMSAYMADEFARYQKGEPAQYEVTESMLATMA